jgi:hypothetical protein
MTNVMIQKWWGMGTIEENQHYKILLDMDGTILSWRHQAESHTAKGFIGQNFRDLFLPYERQKRLPEKWIQRAEKTGRTKQIGLYLRKDGSVFLGSSLITAFYDDYDEAIFLSVLVHELKIKFVSTEQ